MAQHPAAFINNIADEGTKSEAVEWLQKTWDDYCEQQDAMRRIVAVCGASSTGVHEKILTVRSIAQTCLEK